VPGQDEVLVRVRAIGLNFADGAARAGVYPKTPKPPFVPGLEVAGEIERGAAGRGGQEPGTRVLAIPLFGGHAERVAVASSRVFPIPDAASFEEAAAFGVAFLTADHALREAGRVRRGERVLVNAAMGGVGTAILQLSRSMGARVLAVASTEEKRRGALALGAEDSAGYEDWPAAVREKFGGVDVVLDSVGGAFFRRAWRLLDRGGRYVLYGFASAFSRRGFSPLRAVLQVLSAGAVLPFALLSSNRTLCGFNLSLLPGRNADLRDAAGRLEGMWRSGEIRPVVGLRLPFGRLPEGHAALTSRSTVGKIVLSVP
jgi:NADPH:quinone reductase-like Zn-dependent oxidoreductase